MLFFKIFNLFWQLIVRINFIIAVQCVQDSIMGFLILIQLLSCLSVLDLQKLDLLGEECIFFLHLALNVGDSFVFYPVLLNQFLQLVYELLLGLILDFLLVIYLFHILVVFQLIMKCFNSNLAFLYLIVSVINFNFSFFLLNFCLLFIDLQSVLQLLDLIIEFAGLGDQGLDLLLIFLLNFFQLVHVLFANIFDIIRTIFVLLIHFFK